MKSPIEVGSLVVHQNYDAFYFICQECSMAGKAIVPFKWSINSIVTPLSLSFCVRLCLLLRLVNLKRISLDLCSSKILSDFNLYTQVVLLKKFRPKSRTFKGLTRIHRRIWGGAKGCFAPPDSCFAPPWTFETKVLPITDWKLFTMFL